MLGLDAAVDTIPEGFSTIEQVSEQIGRADSQTRKILREKIAKGTVETRTVKMNGKIRVVYRPVAQSHSPRVAR